MSIDVIMKKELNSQIRADSLVIYKCKNINLNYSDLKSLVVNIFLFHFWHVFLLERLMYNINYVSHTDVSAVFRVSILYLCPVMHTINENACFLKELVRFVKMCMWEFCCGSSCYQNRNFYVYILYVIEWESNSQFLQYTVRWYAELFPILWKCSECMYGRTKKFLWILLSLHNLKEEILLLLHFLNRLNCVIWL